MCSEGYSTWFVCMCVCVRSNMPPHTLESQKRGTNGFIAIRERFKKGDLAKNALFKSDGVICLPQQSMATMQCS